MLRNIANDLFQLEFHELASDDELMLFYGSEVDREKMITDTERKLDGDQRLLRFYKENFNLLYNKYGKQNPTGSIDRGEGSDVLQVSGSGGDVE